MGLRNKICQILYVGQDKGYWQKIKSAFNEIYPDRELDFQDILLSKDLALRAFYRGITQNPPKILIADLTSSPETILRLVFDLKNEYITRQVLIVGLLDRQNTPPALAAMAVGLGVTLTFVKQADLQYLAHHVFALTYPGTEKPINIKRVNSSFESTVTTFVNVGFVTPDYIHFESNFKFLTGQHLKLKTKIFPTIKISDSLQIVRRSEKNTYGRANYWFEANYVHPSSIEKDLHAQLEQWFKDNMATSRPKRARLLAIDKTLAVFGEGKENFDDYKFSLRCCAQLDPQYQMLEKCYPGVIAYQIERPVPGAKRVRGPVSADRNNDHWELERIVDKIKTMKGYTPFIFIFNYDGAAKDFQDFLHYPYVLTNKQSVGLKILATVMTAYDKGKGKNVTHAHQTAAEPEVPHYYISKYDPRSLAEYKVSIKALKISEYDIVFSASPDLPLFATFYAPDPYHFAFTIVPHEKFLQNFPKFKGRQNYYALIHEMSPETWQTLSGEGNPEIPAKTPAAPKTEDKTPAK